MAGDVPLAHPRQGYLFIVTYGRSGSTVLQALLNAIPGYCIRGENRGALEQLCRVVAALEDRPPAGHAETDDPWFGFDSVDAGAVSRALFGVFCREFLRLPPGTRVGGFKEIRYVEDPDFLPRQLALMEAHFPQARFIFLTRDPGDVALSGWWPQWPADEVMADIAAADRRFAGFAAGRANCFQIDHADLVPGSARLRALFGFLREDYDPARVAAILAKRLTHGRAPG
jgi:hypothetical protein